MTNNNAIHFWVSGRVQGVCFRQSTQQQAQQLELTGWVKNLPDGRVEGVVCGPQKDLKQMLDWLHQGPPSAQVTGLHVEPEPAAHYRTFTVEY